MRIDKRYGMEQLSLFSEEVNMSAPLASRLRPRTLDDYIGQEHLVGQGRVDRKSTRLNSSHMA